MSDPRYPHDFHSYSAGAGPHLGSGPRVRSCAAAESPSAAQSRHIAQGSNARIHPGNPHGPSAPSTPALMAFPSFASPRYPAVRSAALQLEVDLLAGAFPRPALTWPGAPAARPALSSDEEGQSYTTLRMEEDTARRVHWCYMHRDHGVRPSRACFTTAMLDELRRCHRTLADRLLRERREQPEAGPAHVVLASDADAFSFGGDLDLFCRLIREGDRGGLLAYARTCVEAVRGFDSGLGVHTIALVQGDALGGGLEAALVCHTIVAERGVKMGLPEVLFDLFPGMGAYSLLRKRVSPRLAEKLMLEGKVYTSDEFYAMGLVDVLAPRGGGRAAVEEVIRASCRIPHAWAAMQQVREEFQPVRLEELMRITEVWVETALQLGEDSLRVMERLVRAQVRRGQRVALA